MVACYGHRWEVEIRSRRSNVTKIVTTLELKDLVDSGKCRVLLPKIVPAKFVAVHELPIDPYLLGILLAEGALEKESVSFAQELGNTEVIERVRAALPSGHYLKSYHVAGNAWKHRITVGNDGPGARNVRGRNKIQAALHALGLSDHRAWQKFVPEIYKFASVEDRTNLLRGYMDGDGSIKTDGNIRVSSSSENLAKDIKFIVNSLGGHCRYKPITGKTYVYNDKRRNCRDEYRINGMNIPVNPFFMRRKADLWKY